MSEIWKDIYFVENGIIYDYRGKYQVSNEGRVESLNYGRTGKEKILKAGNVRGYEQVILFKNGKQKNFKIHRLVAHMFLTGYFEGAEVNHIDENKTNNHVSNLEWCDRKYNNNYGTRNERANTKISDSMKGKNKGENNGMYGVHRYGEKNPNTRKVVMTDPNTKLPVFTWQYKKQATDFYGISGSTLNYYLKGRAKSGNEYNGFLWYYLEDWQQLNK